MTGSASGPFYAACRTKRYRPTKAEMAERREAIAGIVWLIQPCSVRQAFYQAEIKALVEKTETGYEKVQRAIVWLRQRRKILFSWISDATRWMREPDSYDSIVTWPRTKTAAEALGLYRTMLASAGTYR